MFEGKVILVVDDESDLREILRDELAYEGAQVLEAANGKAALTLLKTHTVDAVLSDIRMPGGDGTNLLQELRQISFSEPIILLITGFADLQIEESYDLGAEGYVSKPFHLEDLKKTLSRLLQKPPARWLNSQEEAQSILKVHLSIEKALAQKKMNLGRGGFFLETDCSPYNLGDTVNVQFASGESIIAKVCWSRSDDSGGAPFGMGLEIRHLNLETLEKLKALRPQFWVAAAAYIPKA